MLDTTDNTRESDTCQVMNGSDHVSVADIFHNIQSVMWLKMAGWVKGVKCPMLRVICL